MVPVQILLKKQKTSMHVCYLFLQLFHKLNGVGERLPLVMSQRLQVQDGLSALSLQDSDGLQQPLVAETEWRHVKTAVGRTGPVALFNLTLENCAAHQTFRTCIIQPRA